MRPHTNAGAAYLTPSRSSRVRPPRRQRWATLAASLLALLFLVSGLSLVSTHEATLSSSRAFADDANAGFEKAVDGEDPSQEGFDELLREWDEEGEEEIRSKTNSLTYAIFRQFSVGYLNLAPKAVTTGQLGDPRFNGRYNCSVNAPGAGTLMYHNCDVPNLLTEFLQDGVSLLLPEGPQNAEQETAYMGRSRWGLSSRTPRPINLDSGIKYTALEKYGYNLKFTSYAGEWDRIKVMTSARALSNFGLMDNLKLGVSSIVNGLTGGLETSLTGMIDDLTSGNLIRIATAPFSSVVGFFTGGSAAGVNTIMDTSDTNVFASNGWYRPGFASTAYGVRELGELETAAIMQQNLLDAITASLPADARPPADLRNMQNPPRPAPPVCRVSFSSETSNFSRTHPDPEGLTSQALCRQWGQEQLTEGVTISSVTYTPAEDLATWQGRTWGSVASAYSIPCSVNTTADRAVELTKFYGCWNTQWRKAVERELVKAQEALNMDWWEKATLSKNVAKRLSGRKNFNDPRARYVCTDKETGEDLGSGDYVYLFRANGTLNNNCQLPVRAPIQGGLFGDGYEPAQAQPVQDLRREQFKPSLFNVLGYNAFSSGVADAGLAMSTVTTRVSNTILNISMGPILETIGLDVIVAEMVKGFRDSIFYPLAVIFVAVGGLVIFFNTLKDRSYTRQFGNAVLLALTFVAGVIVMERPEQIIQVVDDTPAAVEAVIIGTIFEVGSSDADNLCTATDAPGAAGRDFEGNRLTFNPSAATRVLLCENWRTFAFSPYVYGQWGAAYPDLATDAMENTNQELVGDAEVSLGSPSQTEKNWALYALDSTLSGTTITPDVFEPSGAINPNFYKVVDMQAHPNVNGVGNPDPSYFHMWSGNEGGARAMIAVMGALLSVLGLVTVAIYAFAKIQVSLVVTLLLLFMPFIFLIGLHPTSGRTKLKGYFAQIVSLMIQRVMLVTMLALMMRLITAMATSTANFFLFFVLVVATCGAFLAYRKEVIGLFSGAVTNRFGGFGGAATENPGAAMRQMNFLPRSASNYVRMKKSQIGGGLVGAAGGFVVGGVEGAKAGASMNSNREKIKTDRFLARQGQGAIYSAYQGGNEAKDKVREDLLQRVEPVRDELRHELLKNKITAGREGEFAPGAEEREAQLRLELAQQALHPNTRQEFMDLSASIESKEKQEREVSKATRKNKLRKSDRDRLTREAFSQLTHDAGEAPELDAEELRRPRAGEGTEAAENLALEELSARASSLHGAQREAYQKRNSSVLRANQKLIDHFEARVEEEFLRREELHAKEVAREKMRASSQELADRLMGDKTEGTD